MKAQLSASGTVQCGQRNTDREQNEDGQLDSPFLRFEYHKPRPHQRSFRVPQASKQDTFNYYSHEYIG